MNTGNLEPDKAPTPTVLPSRVYYNDDSLDITPVKIKPEKVPSKCKTQKVEAKKKVIFADEEVDFKENRCLSEKYFYFLYNRISFVLHYGP